MANVTVDVDARINERELRRSELAVHRSLTQMGHQAGVNFGREFASGFENQSDRIQRAAERSASATDKLTKAELDLARAMKSGDTEKIISARRRLARVNTDLASQSDRLAKSQRDLHASLTGDASNAGREVANLTSKLSMLGSAVRGAGPAALAVGAVPATAAIGQLIGVIASASQSLIALPAIAGAAAAGIGTVALATKGFGDALADLDDTDKFVEDLRKLSPNAQQAALAIRSMKPAFDDLQQSAQNAFFANIGPQLQQLSATVLPEVKVLTTSVATSLNGMLTGVMSQLQTSEGLATIHTIVTNIATAFQNLQPAVAPATQAIMTLVQAGSGALPALATAATNAANAFANWARNGDLQTWLAEGLTTLEQLGPAVGHLVDAFFQLGDIGRQALPDIIRVIDQLADALPGVIQLATDLSTPFMTLSETIGTVHDSWDGLSAALKVSPFGQIDAEVLHLKGSIESMLNPLKAVLDAFNAAKVLFGLSDEGSAISNAQARLNDALAQAKWGAPPPGATAAPGAPGTPGGPPAGLPVPGGIGGGALAGLGNNVPSSNAWNSPANPFGVSGPGKSGGSGRSSDGPQVPYPDTDPRSLIQGYPETASLFGAAREVIESQYKLAQDQAELNDLERSNTATAAEIQAKKNDLVKDAQDQHKAELNLAEAKKSASDSLLKANETASKAFSDISAGLDADLGISKGLPGLADNLVRFVAKLATAPLMGALSQITGGKDASATGSGVVGMLAANSPQYQQQYLTQTATGGYPGDAALLSNVPVGKYAQTQNNDLTKGLADCSSAVEDLVNIMDGRPTGGRQMSTANAADWLQSRGFLPGEGGPGDFRVGYNAGHMQATLPGGTPFNWGSDAAAANRGIGGSGAYDPSFTDHYYRPTTSPPWAPQYSGGGGGPAIGVPATTPAMPGAPYAPLSPTQLTDPGLTPPPTPVGGGTGGGGGGMSVPGSMAAPPQALPSLSSSQINNPGQDPNAWQPAGGGGNAGIGGLAMSAISAAISAGGGAGSAFGGQAAAAAAQMAMQAINRTIAFGGQAAGDAVGGLLETFSVGGSSLADPMQGWLGRIVGSLAGAKPATASMTGDRKDQLDKKNQQDPNGQGQKVTNTGQQGGVQIGTFVQAENRNGQQVLNDLAFASAGQGSR